MPPEVLGEVNCESPSETVPKMYAIISEQAGVPSDLKPTIVFCDDPIGDCLARAASATAERLNALNDVLEVKRHGFPRTARERNNIEASQGVVVQLLRETIEILRGRKAGVVRLEVDSKGQFTGHTVVEAIPSSQKPIWDAIVAANGILPEAALNYIANAYELCKPGGAGLGDQFSLDYNGFLDLHEDYVPPMSGIIAAIRKQWLSQSHS